MRCLVDELIAMIRGKSFDKNDDDSVFDWRITEGKDARELWERLCNLYPPTRMDTWRASDNRPFAYYAVLAQIYRSSKHAELKTQSAHRAELMEIFNTSQKLRRLLQREVTFGDTFPEHVAVHDSGNDDISELGRFLNISFPHKTYGANAIELHNLVLSTAVGYANYDDAMYVFYKAKANVEKAMHHAEQELIAGRNLEDLTDPEIYQLEDLEPIHNGDWLIRSLECADVCSILQEIERRAKMTADSGVWVKKPASQEAKRTLFIRRLHDFHLGFFGSHKWEILALASTLALDIDPPLSSDDVRPLCR